MARKGKAIAGNKIDPEVAKQYIGRIEQLALEIATEQAECMVRCKQIRSDIKEVYLDAKDAGLTVKPLKALIKVRALEHKQQAVQAELDSDQLTEYEQLEEALGDFASSPLGEAALEQSRSEYDIGG